MLFFHPLGRSDGGWFMTFCYFCLFSFLSIDAARVLIAVKDPEKPTRFEAYGVEDFDLFPAGFHRSITTNFNAIAHKNSKLGKYSTVGSADWIRGVYENLRIDVNDPTSEAGSFQQSPSTPSHYMDALGRVNRTDRQNPVLVSNTTRLRLTKTGDHEMDYFAAKIKLNQKGALQLRNDLRIVYEIALRRLGALLRKHGITDELVELEIRINQDTFNEIRFLNDGESLQTDEHVVGQCSVMQSGLGGKIILVETPNLYDQSAEKTVDFYGEGSVKATNENEEEDLEGNKDEEEAEDEDEEGETSEKVAKKFIKKGARKDDAEVDDADDVEDDEEDDEKDDEEDDEDEDEDENKDEGGKASKKVKRKAPKKAAEEDEDEDEDEDEEDEDNDNDGDINSNSSKGTKMAPGASDSNNLLDTLRSGLGNGLGDSDSGDLLNQAIGQAIGQGGAGMDSGKLLDTLRSGLGNEKGDTNVGDLLKAIGQGGADASDSDSSSLLDQLRSSLGDKLGDSNSEELLKRGKALLGQTGAGEKPKKSALEDDESETDGAVPGNSGAAFGAIGGGIALAGGVAGGIVYLVKKRGKQAEEEEEEELGHVEEA